MTVSYFNPGLPMCGVQWPNLGPTGGLWTCTLDRDHYGYHKATGPGGDKVFSVIAQDDDEVIDPQAVVS